MKDLTKPLENGLIPMIEIAKLIYPLDKDESEPGYVDINKPKFRDGGLLISRYHNGGTLSTYLFFENNQFKIKTYDIYYLSDYENTYTTPVEYDPIKLIKKLIELGVTSYEEVGL